MQETALVVKSNTLVEASHKLGEVEQNLVLLAIVKARENYTTIEQLRGKELQISADDYMTIFGATRQGAYHSLKQAVLGLFEEKWGYKYINDKGNVVVAYERFTQSAKYINGEGLVKFTFADAIIPMLVELEKRFTSYEIKQVANLSSGYAMRLYEFFMQYFDKKEGKGWLKISLDDLRFRFGLLPTEYTKMGNFKDYVLDLAMGQINENTDLEATYTQHKNGRKIVGFTFEFKYKKGREPKNQDTISLAKGGIYDGIATEPKPTERLTAPKQPLIPPLELEAPTPQAVNAELELTELERIAIAEVCAYADKIGATPSHRQNLVAKALKESREQAKIQEQAKDLATAQKQAKEQALQAMAQKQQQKEQAFDEFWARASLDEKRVIYEYVAKRAVGNYHIQEFKKALETGDFSTVQDPFFTHHELMRPLFIAGYDVFTKNQTPMPNKAPIKPTNAHKDPDPTPTKGGELSEALNAPQKLTDPQSNPDPTRGSVKQLFANMTKDEQETVKTQALAYINDNGITEPQAIKAIKERAVIERWGLDVF